MTSTNALTSTFRQAYLLETLGPRIVRRDTPEDWALLEDPLTPQAKALQWMSEDDIFSSDPESLDDKILLDRYVLAVLYFSTSGPDWQPYFPDDLAWDFTEFPYLKESLSVCDWNKASDMEFSFYDSLFSSASGIGVSCTSATASANNSIGWVVSSISLNLLNLTGTIPWEISLLERLSHLSLFMNEITGTLPTELGNLLGLQALLVDSNSNLYGTIPTEVGKLSRLTEFSVHGTQIGGTIPSEIGYLQQLLSLGLWATSQFIGTIPTEIGHMSSLTDVSISGQLLTGTIPSEIASLSNLRSLLLYDNPGLTGTLPIELNMLELDVFSVRNTSLTGSIDFVCPQSWNDYVFFQADCLEDDVDCSCCDICCEDGGYCETYNNKSDGSSILPPDFFDDAMDRGLAIRLDVLAVIVPLLVTFSVCSSACLL